MKSSNILHSGRAVPTLFRPLCLVQGAYYLVTGIWPLLHRKSFEALTGPKTDFWLVRTVGVLVTAIGAVLTYAGWKDRALPEVALLGAMSAAGLLAIDVVYVVRERIPPVYLGDGILELALLVGWIAMPVQGMRTVGGAGQSDSGENEEESS
ncbi:MAG: hypothetical protein R3272_15775 [Candidatus Promineifilaceae bacterium]|nr:hypothetical protein [Candidatus Promineifilaceae bacterium]